MRREVVPMGRNGDGIWVKPYKNGIDGRFLMGWRDEDGKQRRKVIKAAMSDVEQLRGKALARMGKKAAAEKTLSQIVPEYLKFSKRQKSYKEKVYICNALEKKFGDMPLSAINTLILEQYQSELLEKGIKPKGGGSVLKGAQPSTVNRHVATLKNIAHKALQWQMISPETYEAIRQVKLLKEENARLRYLSKEEAYRLLAKCRESLAKDYLYPIVMIALNTGMRKREILSLEWNRIDLRNSVVLLERTKNGRRREVPLNDTVVEVFRALPRPIDDGKLFTNRLYHWGAWEVAVRRAGIKDFHFHDLRHTFASWMVMAGADIPTVQSILGHKTVQMTMRYAHLSPDHRVAAVKLLDVNNVTNVTRFSDAKIVNL